MQFIHSDLGYLHQGDVVEVVLSGSAANVRFFSKGWPQYELDGLVTMANSGKQVILPLWHEISKDEVMRHSASLADKIALRTSDYSVDEIAKRDR